MSAFPTKADIRVCWIFVLQALIKVQNVSSRNHQSNDVNNVVGIYIKKDLTT